MQTLTLFYDPHCGLCTRFKLWLTEQATYVHFQFIGYDTAEAEIVFPGLARLDPAKDIVVLADDGRWWQGPEAWITTLWTLHDYRDWAFRLSTPMLRPMVRKLCYLISEKRVGLSTLLRLRSERDLAALADTPVQCDDSGCRL